MGKKIERALILSGGGARGAFEVGVIKYLEEKGWRPDLICGTSVGAINAAAIGSGMSIEDMIGLWKKYHRKQMYHFTTPAFLRTLLSGRKFSPLSDTRPLKRLIKESFDIGSLRNSSTEILVAALNMRTSQIRYFTHRVIEIEHLMAAGAIPMLFPWQYIDGSPYWDAGIMANTPIAPALGLGAKEIIVVLLSPLGAFAAKMPKTHREVAELVFEQFLIGSYTVALHNNSWQVGKDAASYDTPLPDSPQLQLALKGKRLATVAPTRMLGFKSLLNFTPRHAERLLEEGYQCARMQIGRFIR
ncbi:MAG: patatin-like phospholipase family protein [Deltaproteobacteria bacterium]|nr:patatin-like phospholipase family protein [Deltaproteobacteria bacterium]